MIGVILAGGTGRRMGGNKPWVRVDGVPLIGWAAETLRASGCEEVWAVFRRRDHRWEGPWLEDAFEGGPAAGLRTVLREFEGWQLIVTACDVLFDPVEWVGSGDPPKHASDTLFPLEVVSPGDVGGDTVRGVLKRLGSHGVDVRSVDADRVSDLRSYRGFLRGLLREGKLSTE